MLIRTKSTTLLQIFCEFILNSKVIFKSIICPDDTGKNISRHEWVNTCVLTCYIQQKNTKVTEPCITLTVRFMSALQCMMYGLIHWRTGQARLEAIIFTIAVQDNGTILGGYFSDLGI